MWLLVTVSVLLLFSRGLFCCEKETFDDAIVMAYTDSKDNVGKEFTVNGCFGRILALDHYERLVCNDQSVPKMFKGAVTNLSTTTLIFSNIRLEDIEPGAFDLPRISELDLSQNRLTEIKRGIFDPLITLTVLRLNNNKITKLHSGIFSNIVGLKELFLQSNLLTVWDTTWFHNNINLETINIKENSIHSFPADATKEIPSIKNIILRNNKLSDIHPNALSNLYKLSTLDLSENHLKKLPANLFSSFNVKEPSSTDNKGFVNIRFSLRATFAGISHLYLHKNNLTYLPDKVMNDLSSNNNIFFINLHSNPWHCACYKKIDRWTKKRRANVDIINAGCINKSNPLCVIPEKNPDTCLEEVNEELYSIYYATYKEATTNDFFDRNVRCF